MPHVVVVGAGFAGVSAIQELAKEGFRVTLLDRHPYNTFQPLLYQVATGGLNAGDVTYSLRYFSARHDGVRFRRATVVGIDHETREVVCDDGVRIGYDYLIIGNGITTNHFGIPGAAEYSMSMYTRAEALRVRDTIFGGLETIAGTSDPNSGGFTVVIVGGGATGRGDGRAAGRAQDQGDSGGLPGVESRSRARRPGRDGSAPAGAVRRPAPQVHAP